MGFHEDYQTLLERLTAVPATTWNQRLRALPGEAILDIQEARRHLSHIDVLVSRSRGSPDMRTQQQMLKRARALRDIMLRQPTFFEISHGAFYHVVETILERDEHRPLVTRVMRLTRLARVLRVLRLPSLLEIIAKEARGQQP